MAYSYQDMVSDGSTTQVQVAINFIDRSHLSVLVNGALTAYTWLSPSVNTIVLGSAPTAGSVIRIKRTTPRDKIKYDYSKGSQFSTATVDANNLQLLYIDQEIQEELTAVYGSVSVANLYLGPSATPPTVTPGGLPVSDGMMYYNTTDARIYVKTPDGWRMLTPTSAIAVANTVATAGQTVFNTPAPFTPGTDTVEVWVNGARINIGTDYTEAPGGTNITLTSAASVGDEVAIRVIQTLAIGSTASNLVTYGSSTVKDALDAINLPDYNALRSYTGSANTFYITGYLGSAAPSGIAGYFVLDPSDTSSLDDNGIVIVRNDGKRIKRSYSGLVNPKWFLAKLDGTTDDTPSLTKCAGYGVLLPSGTAIVNSLQIDSGNLQGCGLNSKLKAKSGSATVLSLGYTESPSLWSSRSISNVVIDGNSKAADGITIKASSNTELAGRWTLSGVSFTGCNRAFYKPNGNIGNRIRDISVTGCKYGYYSKGQTSPLMHGGSDAVHGGEINSCDLAAIYIDSPQAGTGGTTFRDLIIEGNPGFGVFVKNWADSFTPLVFDNVWLELNATAGSVTIDGTAYIPKEMRLENTSLAIIRNGLMPKSLELVNSRLVIEDSTINDGTAVSYSIDANSVVTASNLAVDGGVHPITVRTLAASRRASGNQAQLHYAPPRVLRAGVLAEKLQSLPYDGVGPFTFNGSIAVNGTSVADGRIFGSCCELVIPNGATLVQPAISIVSGKWYVLTVDIKLVSGSMTGFTFAVTSSVTLAGAFEQLISSKWDTIATVSKCGSGGSVGMYINNATGASVTLRISAWQIAQFDTEQAALDFYNSGSYYK